MVVVSLIAEIAFWICLFLALYTYALYPACIWLAARICVRGSEPDNDAATDLPRVTLLVAAYNEERVIEKKVLNSLCLDYPADRLRIVIASDGSTDAMAEIVSRYADRGVQLLAYRQRCGKSGLLNASIAETAGKGGETRGEILVLSDANTEYDRTAIRNLVRWFTDPRVDVACGRLVLHDSHGGGNVDSIYWRYETFLKNCEGRLGALLGTNGAIYAIRRSAYVPIPDNTIIDDFVIPLLSKLQHNGRIVYDPEAVGTEETPPTIGSEFRRRVRIGTGAYQSLAILWPLLNPRYGWTAFAFFSHKLLRWLVPFFVLGMLLANLLLLGHPLYQVLLVAQLSAFAIATVGAYVPGRGSVAKGMRAAAMLAAMNVALFVGFCRWAKGGQTGIWQRTSR